jgi:hypothetical protein
MFLLGGQYTADTVKERWVVEILKVVDIRDSVGELGVSRWGMELRTSIAVPP